MAVIASIDGPNRRIHLTEGAQVDIELYREYRTLRRTDENLRKFDPLLRMDGNIAKGGGRFTPRYITLLEDSGGLLTKLVPFDSDNTVELTVEIITQDPDTDAEIHDFTQLSAGSTVVWNYQPPAAAEIVTITSGGIAATLQELRDAMALDLTPSTTIGENSIEHARMVLTNETEDTGSAQTLLDDDGVAFSSGATEKDTEGNLTKREKLEKP